MSKDNFTIEFPFKEVTKLNGKNICFLNGSGFSVPYGFNTVGEINQMFVNIKVDDFIILTTSNYGFDIRQTDYYINALIFLNLATRSEKASYCLSEL